MDRQRTNEGLGSTTKTAQAPAEPIRPREVNRADADPTVNPEPPDEKRRAQQPHPGSPQTPK
ncbi:MAG TPA: hypothetical protein VHO67_21600 [Polyangia bacterium]|nr:hypothetical protein [Polyangia bacterium]